MAIVAKHTALWQGFFFFCFFCKIHFALSTLALYFFVLSVNWWIHAAAHMDVETLAFTWAAGFFFFFFFFSSFGGLFGEECDNLVVKLFSAHTLLARERTGNSPFSRLFSTFLFRLGVKWVLKWNASRQKSRRHKGLLKNGCKWGEGHWGVT